MEKIKLNKGILNEINEGCIRLAINLTMKKNEDARDDILKKIGLDSMPIKDTAAIKEYQNRGYKGELEKLSELLHIKDIRIIGGKSYTDSGKQKYESLIINKEVLVNMIQECENNKIDPRENLKFYSDKEELSDVLENNDMIYQFNFKADNNFIEKLNEKYKTIPQEVINNIDIIDSEMDLLRIVKNDNKDYKSKVFIDDKFNIGNSSKEYILEVIDIKTSKEINQYRLEIAMYMLKLHSFIQSREDLKDKFEVSTKGFIMKQIQCETKVERDSRLSKIISFEDMDKKVVNYEEVEERVINLFERDLKEFLDIILNGKEKERYENFNLGPKCRLCSYYGGQRSKKIVDEVKGIYKDDWDNSKNKIELIDKYYKQNCGKFQLCRYLSKEEKSENLNNISELNLNNKKYLLENKVTTQKCLKDNFDKDLIRSNKNILSNKEDILKSISIKQDINDSWKFKSEYLRTTNLPTFADISIYIEEKSEPGGNNLCFAYKFTIPEQLPHKDEKCEEFTKNECNGFFIAQTNTVEEQRRNFLDFLISINERLIKIENNYKGIYDDIPRYAIYYWGDNVFENLKKYFKLVWKYIKHDGEDIGELGYIHNIPDKKRQIKRLRSRLGSIFETKEDLPENLIEREKQKIIKTVPFFNLKKALYDLIILNEDINITLESYSRLFLNKPFYFLNKHNIDSDELDGRYISEILNLYKAQDNNTKRNISNTFEDVIFQRLNIMNLLCIKINSIIKEEIKRYPGLITAPRIIKLNKTEYEDTMLNDLYIYNKLNAGITLMDLINNQNLDINKKNVIGECIILDEKLDLNDDDKVLIKDYDDSKKMYLKYKLNKDSIETKLDEKSIGLVFYPINKREFYYKSFYKENLFLSKYKEYDDSLKSTVADNYIFYNCDDIDEYFKEKKQHGVDDNKYSYKSNFEVNIEKIDRFNKFVIISYNKYLDKLIKFMETEYYFKFNENILIEPKYIDFWSSKLNKTLNYLSNKSNKYLVESIKTFNTSPLKDIEDDQVYTALENYYGDRSNIKLDPSQINAILESLNNKINLIFGPPGTGKTWTISNLILAIYNMNINAKILVMGNYNATDNILEKLSENNNFKENISIYRIRTDRVEEKIFFNKNIYEDINTTNEREKEEKWRKDNPRRKYKEDIRCKIKEDSENKNIIVTSTSQQVAGFLFTGKQFTQIHDFDYIIVDEASQMSVDNFLPALLLSKRDTQFIICGDDKQLGIITNIDMSKSEQKYYQSIYEYFKKNSVNESPLNTNRRSNKSIVEFISNNFGYEGYEAEADNENLTVHYEKTISYSDELSKILLDPKNTIMLIEHFDDLSSKQNNFEADLVIDQIQKIYEIGLVDKNGNKYNDIEFFTKGIGVVVPHRAQKSYIQNKLVDYFKSKLSSSMDMDKIIELSMLSTDTVERYQGGERDIIFCSYTVSDIDWIKNEEEFIYNPRRLNVMISRAKCKAIVIASNNLLDYVSEDDEIEEMQQYMKNLKYYLNKVNKTLEYNSKKINIRYIELDNSK